MSEESDERTVQACPHCDSPQIWSRHHEVPRRERWRCRDCGETFAEPDERSPEANTAPNTGTDARALVDADPEAYPDGGRVVSADGPPRCSHRMTAEYLRTGPLGRPQREERCLRCSRTLDIREVGE